MYSYNDCTLICVIIFSIHKIFTRIRVCIPKYNYIYNCKKSVKV